MPEPIEYQKDVFISYCEANRSWVQAVLLPRLEAAGLRVAVDYRDFQVGAPRVVNIERAVDNCYHTLLVMTPEWLKSDWGSFEQLLVQSTDPAGRRRRMIPLLLEPTRLPKHIAMLSYADLTGSEEQDENEMQRLLRGLATKSRVFLSYKPGIEPDESLASTVQEALILEGHQVFTAQDVVVGMGEREGIHYRITQSDYVIALLSHASIQEEEIADVIGYASSQHPTTGKARVLPVRVSYMDAFPRSISSHLQGMGCAAWSSYDDEEKVVHSLLNAISSFTSLGPPVSKAEEITPEVVASRAKLWPNGSAITVSFLEGAPTLQWKVAKAALEWTKYANLRFIFCDDPGAHVRITFGHAGSWSAFGDTGSWSTQGTDTLSVPKGRPTMNFGWLQPKSSDEEIRWIVLHEFGHVLGLVHEHQLANANIPWDREVIYKHFTGSPNHWTRQEVDMHMFQTYDRDCFPIEKEFDLQSIMMIPIPRNFTKGKFEVGRNMTLSDKDKEFAQRLYPSE